MTKNDTDLSRFFFKTMIVIVFQFIANLKFTCSNNVDNRSHFYKVNPETGSAVHVVPENDTRFALLANFFTSNGLGGEVSGDRLSVNLILKF